MRTKVYDWRAELQKTIEAAADYSDTPEDFISFVEACGYDVDSGIRRHYLKYSKSGEAESCANDELILSDYARYRLEKIFNERRGCNDCPRSFY